METMISTALLHTLSSSEVMELFLIFFEAIFCFEQILIDNVRKQKRVIARKQLFSPNIWDFFLCIWFRHAPSLEVDAMIWSIFKRRHRKWVK